MFTWRLLDYKAQSFPFLYITHFFLQVSSYKASSQTPYFVPSSYFMLPSEIILGKICNFRIFDICTVGLPSASLISLGFRSFLPSYLTKTRRISESIYTTIEIYSPMCANFSLHLQSILYLWLKNRRDDLLFK